MLHIDEPGGAQRRRGRIPRGGLLRLAPKPQLARQMLAQALTARVPARRVTGASMYGDDLRLRMWLEARSQAYVLAVSGTTYPWLGWHQRQVKTVLAALPQLTHAAQGALTRQDHAVRLDGNWQSSAAHPVCASGCHRGGAC
jgi:hypothetical protein